MTETPSSRPSTCLALFAKYWEPGKVKTRLAAAVGDQVAADVYRAFLETLLWRFGEEAKSVGEANAADDPMEHVVAYAPENRDSEFREFLEFVKKPTSWHLQSQGSGDLGERLELFFKTRFQAGNSKVVVIGTDSPTVPGSYLSQATRLLDSHDVVLGPTEDGGYYLVAAKEYVPPIFNGIAWSTERVWQQTIARLQDFRVKFAVLPTWYDVDNIEDLQRLRVELTATDQNPAVVSSVDRGRVAEFLHSRLRPLLDS